MDRSAKNITVILILLVFVFLISSCSSRIGNSSNSKVKKPISVKLPVTTTTSTTTTTIPPTTTTIIPPTTTTTLSQIELRTRLLIGNWVADQATGAISFLQGGKLRVYSDENNNDNYKWRTGTYKVLGASKLSVKIEGNSPSIWKYSFSSDGYLVINYQPYVREK